MHRQQSSTVRNTWQAVCLQTHMVHLAVLCTALWLVKDPYAAMYTIPACVHSHFGQHEGAVLLHGPVQPLHQVPQPTLSH